MRICGVDPGLRVTGYGVIETAGSQPAVLEAGTISSDSAADLSQRLRQIYVDLCEVLDTHKPGVLAVEQVYSHYNHPQTAVLMGHVRGVVLLAAAERNIEVAHFAATQIKRALTGNGRASKAQVQQVIRLNLGLETCPEPHDVADALAIALCHVFHNTRNAGNLKSLARLGAAQR